MDEERKIPAKQDLPVVEDLTPEQIEQVVGGEGTGGGAGKVNVGDLSFTHYVDAPSTRLTS